MRKIALVTGSSRGIGAATALRLAQNGFDLCINYLKNTSKADEIVSQIKATGVKAIAFQADLSVESEAVDLFNCMDRQLGTLDCLVNNAGILMPQTRVVDMTADRINRILATNVTGYFICCREAIKRMSIQNGGKGGCIVNISSIAARLGAAGEYVDYAASKGAVDTLTRGLALETASEGIRVNCVRPGLIYTDIHADGGEPERVDRLKSSLPLGRGGTVQEVAAAVAWLVSDEASYSTGSFIDVAGGR